MSKRAASREFVLCVDQPAALHEASWWEKLLCRLEELWLGQNNIWVVLGDLVAFAQGWLWAAFVCVTGVLTRRQPRGTWYKPWAEAGNF